MCLVLTLIEEVVDGITVSEYDGIIAPLVTQNVNQQTVARTTWLTFETLVSAHYLTYVTLLYQGLEGREIGFPKVTIGGLYVH